jgi:N-acetylglucosaminyl-diphospho-decaprenol L-rhamnosyltransferase
VNVLIVIVNYRTADLTLACLERLAAEQREFTAMRAIVVDGASGDGSAERLAAALDGEGWTWAELLVLERNGGFAFANNAAIRRAMIGEPKPDFVLLLNPDTLPRPDAVQNLARFMLSHPEIGIAGSRLEEPDGTPQRTAHGRVSPLSELDSAARLGLVSRLLKRHIVSPPVRDAAHECDWVSGASMIVRREVFDRIGLLDEGFFLYFEEVDLCRRAKRAGWSVWYAPVSRVVHLEGSSTGISREGETRPAYWYESRRRYFLKSYGLAGLIAADLLWAFGRATLMLRRALRLGGSTAGDPRRFARDLLGGDLRALLRGGVA